MITTRFDSTLVICSSFFVNILHFIALLSANFTDDSTGDCKGLEYTDSKLIYQKLKLTKNSKIN